jgi:FlaA1/EpsC-like NDP-sugar epimerase
MVEMPADADKVVRILSKSGSFDAAPELSPARDSGYLVGKRVLVTGAGGSIGSAFCQIAARLGPAGLTMIDRDDSALHAVSLTIEELDDRPTCAYYLRNICDADELANVFRRENPDVVVHAAALKHVPILEDHPEEAFRVNVLGTRAVLEAAAVGEVETFVNVSTDKASNPVSVLGLTKRLGENMAAYFDLKHDGRFVSVRFGNVIGSRGSFLPTFVERIERNQPLLVTHEEATRFLMSVDAAVDLIITAAEHGEGGDTLIADMGEPIRIIDLARSLLEHSGKSLPIRISGLRAGDKLHEDCFDDSETPVQDAAVHGLLRVRVPPLEPDSLSLAGFLDSLGAGRSARG